MKTINASYRSLSYILSLNTDRLLVPAMIIGALAIASAMFSYPTVH